MWKGLILGIIVGIVGLFLGVYIYVRFGFVDARADIPLGPEDSVLGKAMDASTERHAPRQSNPIPATADNIAEGDQIYTMNCAMCHGSKEKPINEMGEAFYPRVPQFFGGDPASMPPEQNFYIIKHGVRFTAMPSWKKSLSDQQIWKVVAYLASSSTEPHGEHTH